MVLSAKGAIRVLVVDDDPVSLGFAVAVYRHHGCDTWSARAKSAALEIAEQKHPDLIVLDIQIGETDGLQLRTDILARDETYHPEFVALTGETRPSRHAYFLSSGCSRVPVKPSSAAQLLGCLDLVCAVLRKSGEDYPLTRHTELPALEQHCALKALDGDRSLLTSLRLMYTSELKSLCPRIDDHLLLAQFDAAAKLVHRLNAAAGYCGAQAFRQCCRSLESALQSGNAGTIAKHYADFLLQAGSLSYQLAEPQDPHAT